MITVILNCYKRLDYLEKQIKAIKSQSIAPEDIMIWFNKPEDGRLVNIDNYNLKVAYSNYNFKFHGRFAYGLLAKTKYVAFFDDDTIPGPDWFKNCITYMNKDNYILGTTGVILNSNNYSNNTKIGWNGIKNDKLEIVDLVGHAWFLKRDTLKYLWQEYPVSWENGEDIQLSAFSHIKGNVKTAVPPHPLKNKNIWGSNYGHLGQDKHSTWLTEKNHSTLRNTICNKVIEMGYKRVRTR